MVPRGLWQFWVSHTGDNDLMQKQERPLCISKANLARDLHWAFARSHRPAPNLTMSELVTCKGNASALIDLDQKIFLLWSWPPLKDMASSRMIKRKKKRKKCVLGKKKKKRIKRPLAWQSTVPAALLFSIILILKG